jgi:dTMP kinase
VVLLDVEPGIGRRRARAGGEPDRIEAESLAFHERVRESFLDLASAAPERYLVLDAARPAEDVSAEVRRRLGPLLPPVHQSVVAS